MRPHHVTPSSFEPVVPHDLMSGRDGVILSLDREPVQQRDCEGPCCALALARAEKLRGLDAPTTPSSRPLQCSSVVVGGPSRESGETNVVSIASCALAIRSSHPRPLPTSARLER